MQSHASESSWGEATERNVGLTILFVFTHSPDGRSEREKIGQCIAFRGAIGGSQRNFRRVSAWKSWNHRRFNNSLALSLNSKQISFTFQRDINLEKSLSPSHSLCIHVCKNKNNFVVIAAKVERKSQQRLSKINFESWKFFLTLDRLRILTKLPPDEHTRRCEENKRKTSNHENKKKIRFHALTKSRN